MHHIYTIITRDHKHIKHIPPQWLMVTSHQAVQTTAFSSKMLTPT